MSGFDRSVTSGSGTIFQSGPFIVLSLNGENALAVSKNFTINRGK